VRTALNKQRQKARQNLLRNPPPPPREFYRTGLLTYWHILEKLQEIHDDPRIDGDTKHELFTRGARQLKDLYKDEPA
jgi:hypothetical protein